MIFDVGRVWIVAQEGCLGEFGEMDVMELDAGVLPFEGRSGREYRRQVIKGCGGCFCVLEVGEDSTALGVSEDGELVVETVGLGWSSGV